MFEHSLHLLPFFVFVSVEEASTLSIDAPCLQPLMKTGGGFFCSARSSMMKLFSILFDKWAFSNVLDSTGFFFLRKSYKKIRLISSKS